jgi:hypothetical protein
MAATATTRFNDKFRVVEIDWTSDASGDASCTVNVFGTIIGVLTNPTDSPSDNWDQVLTLEGFDLFNGGGADRDTTNSEYFVPVCTGSDDTTMMPISASGAATWTLSNAGNAKSGKTIIYFR